MQPPTCVLQNSRSSLLIKNSAKKYSFYVYQTNYNIFVFQGRVLQEKSQLREGYWRETPKNLGEEGAASKRVKGKEAVGTSKKTMVNLFNHERIHGFKDSVPVRKVHACC